MLQWPGWQVGFWCGRSFALLTPRDTLPSYPFVQPFIKSVNHFNISNQILCRSLAGDTRAERSLVSLLSLPLGRYDAVTVLGLDRYPPLMGLLQPRTHKDTAVKVGRALM